MTLRAEVRGRPVEALSLPRKSHHLAGLAVASVSVLAASMLLTGCVRYTPAPRSLPEIADHFAARTASLESAVSVCRALAPTAPCDATKPDRLMLFALLLENNPDIATARAHLRSVEAAARAARSSPAATLTLSTEYARAAGESSPWLLGAALDIPLDRGRIRAARLASADLAVTAARYDLAEAIWSARMGLVRSLNNITMAGRQLTLAGELIQLQERRLAAMDRRVTAGEASRAELEHTRSDLADARHREANARASREAGLVGVARALGLPSANLPVASIASSSVDIAAAPESPNADLRAAALLARADILKAMVAYDQAEAELRGEVAKQYPAFSIGPGFTWERGLIKLPFNIGLTLPPLDLNRRNIAAAEARRSEAGAALEAAYAAAAGSVDAAMAEVRAARQAVAQIQALDLPIARRLAAQADRELAAGAIDRTDWAAAQAGLRIAQLSELDALARVIAADAALEDALRRPLSCPETLIEGMAR